VKILVFVDDHGVHIRVYICSYAYTYTLKSGSAVENDPQQTVAGMGGLTV